MRQFILIVVLLACGTAFAQGAPNLPAPATAIAVAVTVTPVDAPVPVTLPEAVTLATAVTGTDAGGILGGMITAAQQGHWNVFAGLLILLLIWGLNRAGLAAKIGSKWVPWVALLVGAVTVTALGLSQGLPALDALKAGLLDGALAVGLWELGIKQILSKKQG